jgi:cytochrome P450
MLHALMYDILSDRRQHRRIAMQVLNPKAIEGYASVLDYEAHILVRSMYFETRMGTMPINPAHFSGRYTLKYVLVAKSFVLLWS